PAAHDRNRPARQHRVALRAQTPRELERVVVRAQLHANLPESDAEPLRLGELVLVAALELGLSLGVGAGKRRRLVLPALLERVPAIDRELRREITGGDDPLRDLLRFVCVSTRVGVEKDTRAVSADGNA